MTPRLALPPAVPAPRRDARDTLRRHRLASAGRRGAILRSAA